MAKTVVSQVITGARNGYVTVRYTDSPDLAKPWFAESEDGWDTFETPYDVLQWLEKVKSRSGITLLVIQWKNVPDDFEPPVPTW